MNNQQIAKLLRNIAASYTIKNETKYRFQIIAYQRAAEAIQNSSAEVKDLTKENSLNLIPGVGASIQEHLEELINTGKVKHFDWVLRGIPEAIFSLLDIPSFGPKKAYKLVKTFHLTNPATVISDLERIAKEGKIAQIEGFGEKSQQDILRAIAEYEQGKSKSLRMQLPFAYEIAEKMLNYLKQSAAVIEAYPLGSLRRMMPTIGDVDIAVASDRPQEVINHFTSYPYKERVIEKGDATASILISSGHQIDLMIQPKESFGSLLQHFTGSKNHNVRLREFALKKGLSLSEYGIKRKTEDDLQKMQHFSTEEKFYEAIGLQWIPPELRENTGEIELSAKNQLPELVDLKDIKGDLHLHSNYPLEPSHDSGRDAMEIMIKKAIELNYDYVGFSEHNPSLSQHSSSQIYTILSRRKDKIEQIKESNKNIRVINLLEVDILVSGEIAIDEKSLSLLDAVIVSIHSSFGMSKENMTTRILKGLSHPKAKILAHPSGRLLNIRSGYELDFNKIFDFCKKQNKALEINSWPARLDLPDIIVKEAIRNNVKLIINTDSHSVDQMDMMKYGVAVARRGWAEKNDILNTLPYNEFISWLKGGEKI